MIVLKGSLEVCKKYGNEIRNTQTKIYGLHLKIVK